MNIKEITVINFGSIHYLQTPLNPQLSIIETRYLSEVSAAIEVHLCNKTVSSLPKNWVRGDTEINGEVLLNDASYLVSAKADCSVPPNLVLRVKTADGEDSTNQYISLLSHCLEQDAIESFDGQDSTIPMRLCWYRNNEDYQPPECLAKTLTILQQQKTFRQDWQSTLRRLSQS